jgi:3-hydroxyacyl-[acyl-carrier-protein] dehydratase
MPQDLLFDLSTIDLSRPQISKEEVQACNPQRFEFEQLDGLVYFNPEEKIAVASRTLGEDEFWTKGHMPGRPIFPGVLLLEAAAQLCSFYTSSVVGKENVYGFGGADRVRFRRILEVGDTFYLLASPLNISSRRSLFKTQGVVDGQLAFEASIFGIALPAPSGAE